MYGGSVGGAEQEILSSELWELTLPKRSTDVPVWRDISTLNNAPTLARAGHALISAGATLILMGGDTGSESSNNLVYTLDTLATPDPVWRGLTGTPGAAATYQAVGAFDTFVYVYGGSIKGTVGQTELHVADVSCRPSTLIWFAATCCAKTL